MFGTRVIEKLSNQ